MFDEAAVDIHNDRKGNSALASPVMMNKVHVMISKVYTNVYYYKNSMSRFVPQLSDLEGHSSIGLTAE